MATVRPDFINVDLSVASRANLEPLVAALSRHTLLLASYRLRGRHHVRFELNRQPTNAQQGIRAFAQLVRTLPQTARRLWNSARSRDFDIGIEVPRRGDSATLELPQDVVKLASSVRGQIHFTVYASNGRGSPPNKRLKLAARVD